MILCGLTSSFSWAHSGSIILVKVWLDWKVQNDLIRVFVSRCWLSVECFSSPFSDFSSSAQLLKPGVTSLHGILKAVFQEGKSGRCKLSWDLGFTCTSSFLLHSIGQSKLQGQARFKVWENRLHFLIDSAVKHLYLHIPYNTHTIVYC